MFRSYDQLVTDALAKRALLLDKGQEPYVYGTLEISPEEHCELLAEPKKRSSLALSENGRRLCGLWLRIS